LKPGDQLLLRLCRTIMASLQTEDCSVRETGAVKGNHGKARELEPVLSTSDGSDDEVSECMVKSAVHSAASLTVHGCTSIILQSLHDDNCSDSSEDEDEGGTFMVTHVRDDGHLRPHLGTPTYGWRSAQVRALSSQVVHETNSTEFGH